MIRRKNMKNITLLLIILSSLLFLILTGFLSARIAPTDTGRLHVAATIAPVADFAQYVGGDLVDVQLILTPGASPHTFDLTPAKAIQLTNISAIFGIGHGLDSWADGVASISGAPFIALDKQVSLLCGQEPPSIRASDAPDESDQPCDPHYWLSVPNASAMVNQLVEEFSALDPLNSAIYRSNADLYLAELSQLDADIRTRTDTATQHDMVTFHESFTYFAQEYGFIIRATVEPSPGREPSPQQLAALQQAINVYNIDTLYKEPQLSDNVLQSFIKDLNVRIQTLDPLGGVEGRQGYSKLMLYNANTLTQTP